MRSSVGHCQHVHPSRYDGFIIETLMVAVSDVRISASSGRFLSALGVAVSASSGRLGVARNGVLASG